MEAVAPARIEQGNFTSGDMLDTPEAAVPETGLISSLNLLPATSEGAVKALEVRPGFLRSSYGVIDLTDDSIDTTAYYLRQLFYFESIYSSGRHKFLIAILSTGSGTTANGVFCKLDLSNVAGGWSIPQNGDSAVIDLPHPGYEHWGGSASSKWYGGSGGVPMYCWDPSTDTFDDDCAAINVKTWVDDVDDNFDGSGGGDTEQARDYAYRAKIDVVKIGSTRYAPSRDIRFERWNDDAGTGYKIGDKVSRWATWDTDNAYWKSFECIKTHVPADVSDDAPGTGTDTHLYWRKMRLGPIVDDDGNVTRDWFVVAEPSQTIVGRFHGYRLWLRRHDSDNWSWAQYSAPFKPEKNQEVADLVFDPRNWTPSTDVDGNGGGWENFRSSEQGEGDAIRAFYGFGSYLIVLKRWGTHVIAGTDESTWTIRDLDPQKGTIWARSVTAHEGLVYFLDMGGILQVTDGTQVAPAPGWDKVQQHIKERADAMVATDDDLNLLPTLTSFGGFLWITLCDPAGDDDEVLVYEPGTQSWWLTDLPAWDMAVAHLEGVETLFFSESTIPDDNVMPCVLTLTPGFFDDTVKGASDDTGKAATVWSARTAWFHFGLARGDRRIRRTWALVRAATSVVLKGYRNYHASNVYTATRTPYSDTPHIEGKSMHDARAVSLDVSGTGDATFYGVAFDTEPRRTRYHTGGSY